MDVPFSEWIGGAAQKLECGGIRASSPSIDFWKTSEKYGPNSHRLEVRLNSPFTLPSSNGKDLVGAATLLAFGCRKLVDLPSRHRPATRREELGDGSGAYVPWST